MTIANRIILCVFLFLAPFSQEIGQENAKSSDQANQKPREEMIGRRTAESQIKIYGDSPLVKAMFDVYMRDLRRQFRNALDLNINDDWKVHYIVDIYGTPKDVHSGPDVLAGAVINEANQFSIELKVKIHDRFKEETFRLKMIEMLLIEEMLEAHISEPASLSKVGTIGPPDWMVHGFDHNLKHRQLGRPSYFYSGFLKSGQLMSVREIMKPDRAQGLTPLSLEMFRASSAILVGALCEQKNGAESIRGMVKDLALDPNADPNSLILKHFPTFRETDQGIDKWWALQLATMSQQQSFEYYTAAETETYLTQSLEVNFPEVNPPSAKAQKVNASLLEKLKNKSESQKSDEASRPAFRGQIDQYREFLDRPEAKVALTNRRETLYVLKVKAFPLYRDVIDSYSKVCEKLIANELSGLDKELNDLREVRMRISQSIERTKDYLNHYEATRTPVLSNTFDSYIKFMESIRTGSLPPRTDPISTFLDSVEKELPKNQ